MRYMIIHVTGTVPREPSTKSCGGKQESLVTGSSSYWMRLFGVELDQLFQPVQFTKATFDILALVFVRVVALTVVLMTGWCAFHPVLEVL